MEKTGSITLKQRLLAREALVGTWIKTPSQTVAALVPEWFKAGVTFFLLESDQVFLLKGAEKLIAAFRSRVASS